MSIVSAKADQLDRDQSPGAARRSVPGSKVDAPAASSPASNPVAVERLDLTARHPFQLPRAITRLSGIVLLLLFWQLLSSTGRLPSTIVGSPLDVARTAGRLIADGELGSAIAVSLERVATGVVLGVSVGVALALVSGLSRIGEDLVDAPVQMIRTIPFAGLIPLLIIWLGVVVVSRLQGFGEHQHHCCCLARGDIRDRCRLASRADPLRPSEPCRLAAAYSFNNRHIHSCLVKGTHGCREYSAEAGTWHRACYIPQSTMNISYLKQTGVI